MIWICLCLFGNAGIVFGFGSDIKVTLLLDFWVVGRFAVCLSLLVGIVGCLLLF